MAEQTKRTWGGAGGETFAGGGVQLYARMHQGGGDLPPGEIYFEGTHPNRDTLVVFRNADGGGVTVRRVCSVTDAKLAETQFAPGAAAAWGAVPGDADQPSVWTGPNGATFRLLAGGQRASLTPGARR